MGTFRSKRYIPEAEILAIKEYYMAEELSVHEIAVKFNRHHRTIRRLSKRKGWPRRSSHWMPVGRRAQSTPQRRTASKAIYARGRVHVDEGKRREAELYGPLLADVNFLRSRGFVVTCESGGFMVGSRTVDRAGLVATVERERRLAAPSSMRSAFVSSHSNSTGL